MKESFNTTSKMVTSNYEATSVAGIIFSFPVLVLEEKSEHVDLYILMKTLKVLTRCSQTIKSALLQLKYFFCRPFLQKLHTFYKRAMYWSSDLISTTYMSRFNVRRCTRKENTAMISTWGQKWEHSTHEWSSCIYNFGYNLPYTWKIAQ